ncbi:uncharacterized protein MYCGRDRAFT_91065 [Zymoseptoria tritici IPO323]|uniref:Uncharacterized protein n=1 Tax=Zymoseptoria tritici (strain CBS 115943 / IPO323) TaxID=336722 RepID=F9X1T8_ZYMTI|nr:uncharacterized protein MYCGRDRAFT_91065 [Zymoseptoria tritici IPO323]EGP90094.1 hypothetical protein MYCGRDRAFT_91065 [Zymoseptoria tritici IPO323]
MTRQRGRPVFIFKPSSVPAQRKEAVRLEVVVHAEVDYSNRHGLGIGLVQQVKGVEDNDQNVGKISKESEKTQGIKGDNFAAENVKTRERARMLAILHALGMAHSTATKDASVNSSQVTKIRVLTGSAEVVKTVNYHVDNAPSSLEEITNPNDRVMIRKVIKAVKRTSRRGISVSIDVTCRRDARTAKAR